MSTETNDQPADAGVGGQGDAPNDDISTEAFDRMEAPDDDGDNTDQTDANGEGEEGDEADGDPDKPAATEEDEDSAEVELADGRKVKAPKELAQGYLRHQDYTKKTQEVAEQRRALEEERSTLAKQREESLAALPEEHTKVAVLGATIKQLDAAMEAEIDRGLKLKDVNWAAYYRAAQSDPEMKAQYEEHRSLYESLLLQKEQAERGLSEAKSELSTKEAARLKEQQDAYEADRAKRIQETGQALAKEIPGWSPQLARQTAQFMHDDFGVTAEEIAEATDPRLWKMAHGLMTAKAEIAKLKTSLKQNTTAKNHEKAQGVKPAESNKGSGGANARDPSTPRGDGLSLEEWKRRRLAQKGIKVP